MNWVEFGLADSFRSLAYVVAYVEFQNVWVPFTGTSYVPSSKVTPGPGVTPQLFMYAGDTSATSIVHPTGFVCVAKLLIVVSSSAVGCRVIPICAHCEVTRVATLACQGFVVSY